MDDGLILSGGNGFWIDIEAKLLERDDPELLDSDVTVSVSVVFNSKVYHFAFDHSPSACIGDSKLVHTDYMMTTIYSCHDFRMLSSPTENLSKTISIANPNSRPGTDLHDKIVNDIIREVNRNCDSKVGYNGRSLLTLEVGIDEYVLDFCECEECRAIRESVEKLVVPANESSIKKLLKRVRVAVAADLEKDHEDRQRKRRRRSRGSKSGNNLGARPSGSDDCTICSDEFTAGEYAAQMPCLHSFHRPCIEKWLRRSHYCPICRYEMPVADDEEDG